MIKVKGAITRGDAHGFLCCRVIDVTIVLIHSEISVKLIVLKVQGSLLLLKRKEK